MLQSIRSLISIWGREWRSSSLGEAEERLPLGRTGTHLENYKYLVVMGVGYSATHLPTLSKLAVDIIISKNERFQNESQQNFHAGELYCPIVSLLRDMCV